MKMYPYIKFNGTTEVAFNFYKDVFNGNLTDMQKYGDYDKPEFEKVKNLVVYAALTFENNTISGGDYLPDENVVETSNISLSIEIMEVFILENIFHKHSEGGKILVPLQDSFWGARFGMVQDKFGINRMLSCNLN